MPAKIKLPILCLCLILAGFFSFQLYAKELWQYETLGLFISLFFSFLILKENTFNKDGYELVLLSLLTGILLWASFPVVGFSVLLFFAFIPLLIVEKKIFDSEGINKKKVFFYTYISFLTFNITSVYWVGNASLFAGVFAVLVNSALMTLPWIMMHQVRKNVPKLVYPSLVCFWLSFEYLHFIWDLAFPWLTLGNGFASLHYLVQWYEYTGVLGGSLWMLAVNLVGFQLYLNWGIIKERKKYLFQVATLILIPSIFSTYLYIGNLPLMKGKRFEVLCVQPNFEPHYEHDLKTNKEIYERCEKLFTPLLDEQTDYILFPESTFSRIDEKNPASDISVQAMSILTTMEYPDLNIITGMTSYERWKEKREFSPSTRMKIMMEDTTYYHYSNSAMFMEKGKTGFYKKSKLVVGPEFIPFNQYLGFMKPLISKMGGSYHGLATQEERTVFGTENKAAPVICYEQNFGAYLTEYVRNGASWIAIITNDGWWGDTAGHIQHREFAKLRAVETRRYIARAASTGSSCFINPRGDVSKATKYGEEKAIKDVIVPAAELTYYVKTGDFIGKIALFLVGIILANMIVKRRLNSVE